MKSISYCYSSGILVVKNEGTVFYCSSGHMKKINGLNNVEKAVVFNNNIVVIKNDGTVWLKTGDNEPIKVQNLEDIEDVFVNNLECVYLRGDGTVWRSSLNIEKGIEPVRIDNLDNIECISANLSTAFAIKEDGNIFAWGSGLSLGNGIDIYNFPEKTEQIYMPKFKDVEVRTLSYGSYELKDDGNVKLIETGNVNVNLNNLSNVKEIYQGGDNSVFVVKNDGTVWAWGDNEYGQLGDGTVEDRTTPVMVKKLSRINKLVLGELYTFAIKDDGTVWAWGKNENGQLGDGTKTHQLTPVKLTDVDGYDLSEIIDIKTSDTHTIALKIDGTVWTWGKNENGQLGNGTNTERFKPGKVADLSGVISIVAGYNCSLVLKNDGSAWAWGRNSDGQLGNNGIGDCYKPVRVVGLNNIVAIESESNSFKFVKDDLSVWECGGSHIYKASKSNVG